MRSRDGTYSYLRAILLISFLLSTTSLNAEEYLISYRYVVKDAILYNESLFISKSMKKCFGKPRESLIIYTEESNLKDIVYKNSIQFTEFMYTIGLNVEHEGLTLNAKNKSTTILTLKTTCFKVDFNEDFVKITALK